MNKIARIGIVLSLLVAGCAMFHDDSHAPKMSPSPRPLGNCGGGGCTVEVTITGCSPSRITASREPIVVDPGYTGPMHWKIVTPGWNFADPGIQVHDPNAEFSTVSNGANVVTLNNHHRTTKIYKYAINVRQGSGPVCTNDPTIMN
jgi:hypothetical protein